MRLNSLHLENFRCFKTLEIDFHPGLTILTAPNGGGKTSILDAARIALWPYVKSFDLSKHASNSATIQIADVRLALHESGNMEAQLPCSISACGDWDTLNLRRTWQQGREKMHPRSKTRDDGATRKLSHFAADLQEAVRRGEKEVCLPLISYLGTSRLWYEGRFSSNAKDVALDDSQYSRTSGYMNCLSYTSSFKTFSQWYGWIFRSYREEQIEAIERNQALSKTGQRFADAITVVRDAIDTLIQASTGWHRLEYKASQNQQLVLQHPQTGSMPVEMLSDGLRNAIAMVADLAFRAYKLNPHLGTEAARQTPGIALIDEVDMFLHPGWQQNIIGALRQAFPALQLIVTTHSPQVLSTVKAENIRFIGHNAEQELFVGIPPTQTYGERSGDVMHSVMHVDPQPPFAEKEKLEHLTSLVDQGCYETREAQNLMQELQTILGKDNHQLQRLLRSIARQEALRR